MYDRELEELDIFDLEVALSKFKNIGDFVFEGRVFKTNVPSVAQKAYLNILFHPVDQELLESISSELAVPSAMKEFYSAYNGACLFIGALHLYGFHPKGQMIDRSDWRKRLPHNILDVNLEFKSKLKQINSLCLGCYGYDLSEVCIDRFSGQVTCYVGQVFTEKRKNWPSFNNWLEQEIDRLSKYYDESGNRLVNLEATLPSQLEESALQY